MQEHENIIVTVLINYEEIDMELPAFLPIKDLLKKLEETIRVMRPQYSSELSEFTMKYNGVKMSEDKTLAQYGVWDGSKIELSIRKEG